MDRPTFSQRASRYLNIFVAINLVAALVLVTALGVAFEGPENQRLWIIDSGVIGAVVIWLAGTIWRIWANNASH